MRISRETFDEQRRPRFGQANPEKMRLAFWEWMIRGNNSPPLDEGSIHHGLGLIVRRGILKSSYGPYRARDLFHIPLNREEGPIWTFDRMGATQTELPDGRVICIGGEHEDFYDPDFCIYNDVVVFDPADRIEIYGYPREIFPPTDFHTANLIGSRIIIIGCVGYADDRRHGHTPVYSLDVSSYEITKLPTSGEAPGWLANHQAETTPAGVITVRGGQVIEERDGEQRIRRNFDEFALDAESGAWSRLTNRNWMQFYVRQDDQGLFLLDQRPEPEQLLPSDVRSVIESSDDLSRIRFVVGDVTVSLRVEVSDIEILVEGELPKGLAARIAEEVRAKAEAAIQRRCVVLQV